MAYVTLTGKTDLDPAQMAAFAEDGGYTQDGMTTWTLMSEGAERLGLDSEELPADADAVRDALRSGKVVICSVRPGDFTTTGHFIVLAGLADDGRWRCATPTAPKRSRAWTWNACSTSAPTSGRSRREDRPAVSLAPPAEPDVSAC